jgi:hypothetical protein
MILENTQQELYVLNTNKQPKRLSEKETENLEKINISEIVEDKALQNIASTYDRNDGMIRDSFSKKGPYLITFAGILKYDVFPLASIIKEILVAGQKSMGSPVEIEFAVNFNSKDNKPPVFAIIQIRPLVISQEQANIAWDKEDITKENTLIHSNQVLGNGVIDYIKDIVYVSPENFDSAKTTEIAEEVGKINKTLAGKPYLLIGPGRWGTQDPWLGIPVAWRDISNVKIMVETSLEDFNIKPTQGTHFFQNITSRDIGYINITLKQKEGMIDWKWIKAQKTENQLNYVKHVKLSKPLMVKLDGRNGKALVTKP